MMGGAGGWGGGYIISQMKMYKRQYVQRGCRKQSFTFT